MKVDSKKDERLPKGWNSTPKGENFKNFKNFDKKYEFFVVEM